MNKSIPELLRNKRIEKGVPLEKIREEAKIPVKYILALEEGNYKVFPARVYLRGFFLLYCKYLGISEALELWKSLQKELLVDGARANHQPAAKREFDAQEDKIEVSPARVFQENAWSKIWGQFVLWVTDGQNWIIAFVVVPVVILVLVLGSYSLWRYRALKNEPEKALEVSRVLTPAPSSKATLPSVLTSNAALKRIPASAEFKISLSAKEEPVWVSVALDAKDAFQGIIGAGQKRAFVFRDGAKLKIDDPKNIAIFLNDRERAFSQEELSRRPLDLEFRSSQKSADEAPPPSLTPSP